MFEPFKIGVSHSIKNRTARTFKNPLRPPLFLFNLFVQSEPSQCSWVFAQG